jgi:hypothetical protein
MKVPSNEFRAWLRGLSEQDLHAFCGKKTFEVVYAIFRLTKAQPNEALSYRLQEVALSMLEQASSFSSSSLRELLQVVESFLRIGLEIEFLSEENARILFDEIGVLNAAIAEYKIKHATTPNISIADIFSEGGYMSRGQEEVFVPRDELPIPSSRSNHEEVEQRDNGGSEKVANRQSAILNVIGKLPDCHLKTIQENFPHVSERTLRYDLQRLVETGAVERIGNGGPGTYYRTRVHEEGRGYPQN